MLLDADQAHDFLQRYMNFMSAVTDKTAQSAEEWYCLRDEMLDLFHANEITSNDIEDKALFESISRSISGDFCFLKRYKDHCAVQHLKSNKFYAIKSLTTPLESMVGEFEIVTLCILPFNGEILCDGLIRPQNIGLGKNYTKAFRDSYWEAKRNNKLLWSL